MSSCGVWLRCLVRCLAVVSGLRAWRGPGATGHGSGTGWARAARRPGTGSGCGVRFSLCFVRLLLMFTRVAVCCLLGPGLSSLFVVDREQFPISVGSPSIEFLLLSLWLVRLWL